MSLATPAATKAPRTTGSLEQKIEKEEEERKIYIYKTQQKNT